MTDNLLLINIFAWIALHLSTGYLTSRIPVSWFDPRGSWYRARAWERGGAFYQRWFRVKAWKDYIPNGSRLYPKAFSVKRLPTAEAGYLARWLCESCRSEFCHWVMVLQGFLYFAWNSPAVGWAFVAWEALNNIVPIIAQRYNRPRMQRLLQQLQAKACKVQIADRSGEQGNALPGMLHGALHE